MMDVKKMKSFFFFYNLIHVDQKTDTSADNNNMHKIEKKNNDNNFANKYCLDDCACRKN